MSAKDLTNSTPLPFYFVFLTGAAVDNLTAKGAMSAEDLTNSTPLPFCFVLLTGAAASFYLTAGNLIFTGILFRLK